MTCCTTFSYPSVGPHGENKERTHLDQHVQRGGTIRRIERPAERDQRLDVPLQRRSGRCRRQSGDVERSEASDAVGVSLRHQPLPAPAQLGVHRQTYSDDDMLDLEVLQGDHQHPIDTVVIGHVQAGLQLPTPPLLRHCSRGGDADGDSLADITRAEDIPRLAPHDSCLWHSGIRTCASGPPPSSRCCSCCTQRHTSDPHDLGTLTGVMPRKELHILSALPSHLSMLDTHPRIPLAHLLRPLCVTVKQLFLTRQPSPSTCNPTHHFRVRQRRLGHRLHRHTTLYIQSQLSALVSGGR